MKQPSLSQHIAQKIGNFFNIMYLTKQPSLMFFKEQVALSKWSLLLKNNLQHTPTLQLFVIKIETESIYKSY